MATLPQASDDGDDLDVDDSALANDDVVAHAIACSDNNDRWYFRRRQGRFWIREYEKAGCA
jgi:hypothetical protein